MRLLIHTAIHWKTKYRCWKVTCSSILSVFFCFLVTLSLCVLLVHFAQVKTSNVTWILRKKHLYSITYLCLSRNVGDMRCFSDVFKVIQILADCIDAFFRCLQSLCLPVSLKWRGVFQKWLVETPKATTSCIPMGSLSLSETSM